jgi:hypothetical protein
VYCFVTNSKSGQEAASAGHTPNPSTADSFTETTTDTSSQYYPNSNQFAPPPPPGGYGPPSPGYGGAPGSPGYVENAYGGVPPQQQHVQPRSYNPAEYGPTTGPTLPREDHTYQSQTETYPRDQRQERDDGYRSGPEHNVSAIATPVRLTRAMHMSPGTSFPRRAGKSLDTPQIAIVADTSDLK